jgi:cardiolipin synthase
MFIFKNIPNILTISRIIIIPLIVISFYFENSIFAHRFAAILFLIAGITDFLDGYLARAWHSQTNFGRFLDPIADKLLVGAVILMLVHFGRVDILPALAIVCREILVSGLREFLAEIRISVPVSKLAKIKTAVQITSITILLLGTKGSGFIGTDLIGRISLWIAAALTIFTGYVYLQAGLRHLKHDVIQID